MSDLVALLIDEVDVALGILAGLDDAVNPRVEEGDLGVPARDAPATADAPGHDADESLPLLLAESGEGATAVSLAAAAEDSVLVLSALSAQEPVVEPVRQGGVDLSLDGFVESYIVLEVLLALVVGDHGHVGLQQVPHLAVLRDAVALHGGELVDVVLARLVYTGRSVAIRSKVVLDPPAQLHDGDVIVQAGILVQRMLVHLLDFYQSLVRSVVSEPKLNKW